MDAMESFCFRNVIEQADHLPNLSSRQKKVLEKLKMAFEKLDGGSTPSLSSLNLDELSV